MHLLFNSREPAIDVLLDSCLNPGFRSRESEIDVSIDAGLQMRWIPRSTGKWSLSGFRSGSIHFPANPHKRAQHQTPADRCRQQIDYFGH